MGVIIEGIVKKPTDLEVLIWRDGKESKQIWIPRSVISDGDHDFEAGEEVEIEVKTWFAEREGLA